MGEFTYGCVSYSFWINNLARDKSAPFRVGQSSLVLSDPLQNGIRFLSHLLPSIQLRNRCLSLDPKDPNKGFTLFRGCANYVCCRYKLYPHWPMDCTNCLAGLNNPIIAGLLHSSVSRGLCQEILTICSLTFTIHTSS